MSTPKPLTFLLIPVMVFQGCTPLLIGGAATTASVVHDRRTTGTIVDDNTLEVKIAKAIHANPQINNNSHTNITAYNGYVLLTGEALNPSVIQQIGLLAKSIEGTKRVANQIVVGRPSTLMERGYDTKQTAKVKTALLNVSVSGFDPTRVKVVTEHGVTYLMGLVSSQEAAAAAHVASQVSGVKRVVTLFEIAVNSQSQLQQ